MSATQALAEFRMLDHQQLVRANAQLVLAAHRRALAQNMLDYVVVLCDLSDPAARHLAQRLGWKRTEIRRKMAIAHQRSTEPALAFPLPSEKAREVLVELAPVAADGLDDRRPGEQFHIVVVSAGGACIATVGDLQSLN